MEHPESASGSMACRGREIHEPDIRAEVESGQDGEFLVVDITTGNYAVGPGDEVFDRMEARNPDGLLYLARVGRKVAQRIGAGSASAGLPSA